MRPFQLVLIVAGGLLLQACSANQAKEPYTQGEIIDSIMGKKLRPQAIMCPSHLTRFCSGAGPALQCACVSNASLRQVMGGY